MQNLIITPIYLYKKENSTYDKYAYTRTMLLLKAEYKLWDVLALLDISIELF